MILTRNAVHLSAEAYYYISERSVVHIKTALNEYSSLVDAELVALLNVVIKHCAAQVICRCDCVHIAGKVQVDVLHRENLSVTAACGSSFDSEHRTERGLS